MGKGIGKLKTWFSILQTGHTILEFRNLRSGRALYFIKQIQKRIKCFSKIVLKNNNIKINNTFNKKSITYQAF